MEDAQQEVKVKCWHCKKRFPVLLVSNDEEAMQANALSERGGTLRIRRWCPWCEKYCMLEIPLERGQRDEIVFQTAAEPLGTLKPRPAEE